MSQQTTHLATETQDFLATVQSTLQHVDIQQAKDVTPRHSKFPVS